MVRIGLMRGVSLCFQIFDCVSGAGVGLKKVVYRYLLDFTYRVQHIVDSILGKRKV